MKARAVIEVTIVFGLTLSLIALVGLSPIGQWERQMTSRSFIEYAVMMAVPLLVLAVTRRNLESYGLTLRHPRYHLAVAAAAIAPVLIASGLLGLVKYKLWNGALIMSAVEIAVLFVVAWLLRRKPAQGEAALPAGAYLLIASAGLAARGALDNPVSGFIFFLFFVGLGEELLFRGYIQSRLNAAWGRPFQFFGAHWGWGVVITSVLFGLMHVLNVGSLANGALKIEWWWGLWTFFGSFVFCFVREKTGSIGVPAILHGLPEAIAAAFGLL